MAELNAPGLTSNVEVYDSEILEIEKILDFMNAKARNSKQSYESFSTELRERFAEMGLIVSVVWYQAGMAQPDGTLSKLDGVLMPEIVIKDRVNRLEFDREQMRHEVVSNILEMPGQTKGQLIKATPEDMRQMLAKKQEHHH